MRGTPPLCATILRGRNSPSQDVRWNPALHEEKQQVDLNPLGRLELLAGWWTRGKNAPPETGSRPQSSASREESKLLQKLWTYRGAPQSEARRTFKKNGVARPPAATFSALWGLGQASRGRLEVCVWSQHRSQEMCHMNLGEGRQQGRRSVWGGYPKRDRSATW